MPQAKCCDFSWRSSLGQLLTHSGLSFAEGKGGELGYTDNGSDVDIKANIARSKEATSFLEAPAEPAPSRFCYMGRAMQPAPIFRPATLADASALAVLVDIAGEGMPAFMWNTLKAPGQSLLEFGRERARREAGGFSYRNTIVAEIGTEVAAALVGYRLDDPYDLGVLDECPEIVRPLVRLEAKAPGSWYVNVLATFPEFRRGGIGAALLTIAEEKTRKAGAPGSSVIVASWNAPAGRLYRSAGYVASARERALPYPGCPHEGDWILMVKPLA
jgi:ribosomal protein S18 acetylase RimI-like enzyme